MNRKANSSSGFTIIELLLAMAFLSVLMIIITMTVIQIGNVYNKGLTMRAVNDAGTAISADIRQTLSGSQPFDTTQTFLMQSANGGPTTNVGDAVGGRLCTGTYSYIWNLGKSNAPINVYVSGSNQIGFIRIRDTGAHYCADLSSKVDDSGTGDPQEFLASNNSMLAIQSFTIKELAEDAPIGQALYEITLEVGTNNQDALQQGSSADGSIDTIDTSCRPPSDEQSLQDYCAVNKFDFTAEAGNKGEQQ